MNRSYSSILLIFNNLIYFFEIFSVFVTLWLYIFATKTPRH